MDATERAGWTLLALLTLASLLFAILRPTDPASIVSEIRLAAGFDRYQVALREGDRLYSTAVAEIRRVEKGDLESRAALYTLLEASVERFETARRESEGFYEEQRAQIGEADAHLLWARSLYEDATGAWYQRNDRETLRLAREHVDDALALPSIRGDQRNRLEELGKKIDRAITPWPIL